MENTINQKKTRIAVLIQENSQQQNAIRLKILILEAFSQ